ncbi:MAG: septum formation protein Maf [Bacteroidota bacterium]|jgi:septum formation protein
MANFILASQSPRRKQLLEWAEIPFKVVVSETDESYPADLPIDEVPAYIAQHKALAVAAKLEKQAMLQKETCIIAADTVVVLEHTIMGKPLDRMEAISSLTQLSGKAHEVITGVCIQWLDQTISFSATTKVHFHPLSMEQIEFYVDNYQPYDKAGGYAIQEWIGVVGIQKIDGDFYNVMGLPVSQLIQKIKQLGLLH